MTYDMLSFRQEHFDGVYGAAEFTTKPLHVTMKHPDNDVPETFAMQISVEIKFTNNDPRGYISIDYSTINDTKSFLESVFHNVVFVHPDQAVYYPESPLYTVITVNDVGFPYISRLIIDILNARLQPSGMFVSKCIFNTVFSFDN